MQTFQITEERNFCVESVYFGGRYYYPEISRWLSIDPMAHLRPSLTPYHYVQNNPLNRFDPDGKFDIGKLAAQISIAIALFQSNVNSAMNTTINMQTTGGEITMSGREMLGVLNTEGGKTIMNNLPSEQQIVNTLDNISQSASDANLVVGPAAVVTAPIPVVGEVVVGTSATLSTVSVAADVTKAAITGNSQDVVNATVNGVVNFITRGASTSITKPVTDGSKTIIKNVMDGVANTVSTSVSEAQKKASEDLIEKRKDN